MIGKTCVSCRETIVDRYYLVFDERYYHSACLTCSECGCPLEGRCFYRNGLRYCKLDYLRLFRFRTCAKCSEIIEPHQLVMRVNSGQYFFHVDCFTCSQCYCILHKNDYYGLIEGKIYCSDHYSLLTISKNSLTTTSTSSITTTNNNSNNNNNIINNLNSPTTTTNSINSPTTTSTTISNNNSPTTTTTTTNNHKNHTNNININSPTTTTNKNYNLINNNNSSNSSSSSKSKRVRTSFKHAQLKTMKSYFAINQNPDAKDLKGLAAKTGLSKRVLQVWFQNARAKWRKTSSNIKKESETAILDTSSQHSQHSQHHQHHESSGSFSIDYYSKEPSESTGDGDDTLIHHLHPNSLTPTPSSHLHQHLHLQQQHHQQQQQQQQQSQLHMPHQFEQSQTQLPHHPPSLSSTDDEDLNNL